MTFAFNRKGFLGPIGDDLPSLIPLIFALIMFFSTFTYSFNVFESRNRSFNNDISVLKISSALKSNGYIETQEIFMQRCSTIGNTGLNYYAVVTNAATAKDSFLLDNPDIAEYKGIDIYDLRPFMISGSSEPLSCTNVSGSSEIPKFFGKSVVVKVFPVVVEDSKIVKPMHLVVAAWR